MNRAPTTIRRATTVDADSVRCLARSLATTFTLDDAAFSETFGRIMDDEGARLFVAADELGMVNGYLLGFVHDAFFANGTIAWIEEMYVSEEMRRSGVGLVLEEQFELWARNRGATLIALATRRASAFYTAIGYKESASYYRKFL